MKKNDIENKREQFEKLKEVKDKIGHLHPTIIWFGDDGLYHTSFDFKDTVNWLNGAFFAYGKTYRSLNDIKKDEKQDKENKGWECAREAMFRGYKEK